MRSFVILLVLSVSFSVQGQDRCEESTLYPHPECDKYYLCDNGVLLPQQCPTPLYFNPEIGGCDFPQNVEECVDGTRPPTGSTTPGPTGPTTTAAPTTQPPTTEPPTTQPPTTQPPTTEPPTTQPPTTEPPTTQPPTTAVPTTTPPSTTQSPPITSDETPQPEPTESTATTIRTTLAPATCRPVGTHKTAHPELCNAYYLCHEGVLLDSVYRCAEGLYFDRVLEECNIDVDGSCQVASTTTPTPTTTTPPGPPTPDCPQTGQVNQPYPGNCTLYFMCIEGIHVIYRCPFGHLFDSIKLECVSEQEAVCSLTHFQIEDIEIVQESSEIEEIMYFHIPKFFRSMMDNIKLKFK